MLDTGVGRRRCESSLEIIESTLSRRDTRFVLAWAALHRDELADNRRRARAGGTLDEIEPLR
jgi:hypothetical protein